MAENAELKARLERRKEFVLTKEAIDRVHVSNRSILAFNQLLNLLWESLIRGKPLSKLVVEDRVHAGRNFGNEISSVTRSKKTFTGIPI